VSVGKSEPAIVTSGCVQVLCREGNDGQVGRAHGDMRSIDMGLVDDGVGALLPLCEGRLRPREPLCAAGIGAKEWTNFPLTTKTEVCHKVFHREYQNGHP